MNPIKSKANAIKSKVNKINARSKAKTNTVKSKLSTVSTATKNTLSAWLAHLQRLLRHLRLQILTQLKAFNEDQERAQVAIYKNRWLAPLFAIPHLVPLTGALALIALNIQGRLLGEISSSTTTALQFVAKTFELLMQASLATILLGAVRISLTLDQPVALGVVSAPLRTTDVSYLWSLDLWGAVTSHTARRWHNLFLYALAVATVILAALVGPSGAVLLIPRSVSLATRGEWLILMDSRTTMFPQIVEDFNAALFEGSATELMNTPISSLDPVTYSVSDSDGTRQMLSQRHFMHKFPINESTAGVAWETLDTSTVPDSRMMQVLSAMVQVQTEQSINSDSTSPSSLTLETSFWQPVVSADCYLERFPNSINTTVFTPILFPGNYSQIFDPIDLLFSDNSTFFYDGVKDNGIYFSAWPDSLEPVHSGMLAYGIRYPNSGLTWIEACIVDAVWAESMVQIDGGTFVLTSTLKDSPLTLLESSPPVAFNGSWTSAVQSSILAAWNTSWIESFGDTINVYQTWRADQAIGLAMSDASSNLTIIDSAQLPSTGPPANSLSAEQQTGVLQFLQTNITQSKFNRTFIATSTNWTDPATLSQITIFHQLTGSGYSKATTTVKLSLAVLATYCAFVLGHLLWTGCTGRVGSSWDSITDLIMLALNSRQPTHLGKISTGLESIKSFGHPVNIRVNNNNELELTFVDEIGKPGVASLKVEINKEY